VVPEYFAQVGAHMIALATATSERHGAAVKAAMVKHGIVSVPGVAVVLAADHAELVQPIALGAAQPALGPEPLDVSGYGLIVPTIEAITAGQAQAVRHRRRRADGRRRGVVGGAALGARVLRGSDPPRPARLRRVREPTARVISPPSAVKTHHLRSEASAVVLRGSGSIAGSTRRRAGERLRHERPIPKK